MNGSEFRELRLRAGWSIRVAADRVGVAPGTIVRWEALDSVVSSDAADRVRLASGSVSELHTVPYALGRIMRCCAEVWERSGSELPADIYQSLPVRPADHLGQMLALARARSPHHYRAVEGEIEQHMQGIPPTGPPETLSLEQQGAIWLGYYHRGGDIAAATLAPQSD